MIKFSELYSQIDEFKVINKAQRKKMALRMKKITQSSAFKKKVEKSKLKVASPEKIKIKAAKLAKQKVLDKFYPRYKEMPIAQRVKIDQIVSQKYSGMINKIATKAALTVKKGEFEKVKKAKEAKSNA